MANFKWIMSLIKIRKFLFILTIIFLVIETVAFIYSIRLQQEIIDKVIIQGDKNQLLPLITTIAICYIVFSILFVANPYLQTKIYGYIKSHLTSKSINQIYGIPIERLQKERNGQYVHHLSNEVPAVSSLIGSEILEAIKQFSTFIIVSIVIISTNPWLFLLVIGFSLFYFFSGKHFGQKIKSNKRKIQTNKSNLVVFLDEAISSTRDVITENNQKWLLGKYQNIFNKYYQSVYSEGKLILRQVLSQEFFATCAFLTVLGLGGYFIFVGKLSIGMLVVIYQLTTELINSSSTFCNLTISIHGKMAIVERVKIMLENEKGPNRSEVINTDINSFVLDNISFKHEGTKISTLKNLTLDIPIGKKTAIIGKSGSGKSTISHLISRFHQTQLGEIKLNGINIDGIENKSYSNQISVVLQEPYFYSDSIRNNILFGENTSEKNLIEICKVAHIHDFITTLPQGYDTILGERGITMSGGQKQRIAIARALIRDTEILILDEATSAIDSETELLIQRDIDRYRKGKTTIVIAHRLSTIYNADKICIISEGQVIESGKHSDLITYDSFYRRLLEAGSPA
jgi:ABC-type multidrug transport system fused ATPase/permease subunit